MGSPEDKVVHSKRIKMKKKAKVRSVIAKELVTNKRYRQRIIKDKRGKVVKDFPDLIKAIQED